MSITEKRCTKCGKVKTVSKFCKKKSGKDGLNSWCKSCCKQYREENKEHDKKYREENKEYLRQYNKKWYEENKERCNRYRKKYYEENKERCNQYSNQYNKKYYEENKESCNQYSKQYREENKESCRQYEKNNKITINNETYNINTAPDELKPLLSELIQVRNLKLDLKQQKKQLTNKENQNDTQRRNKACNT